MGGSVGELQCLQGFTCRGQALAEVIAGRELVGLGRVRRHVRLPFPRRVAGQHPLLEQALGLGWALRIAAFSLMFWLLARNATPLEDVVGAEAADGADAEPA